MSGESAQLLSSTEDNAHHFGSGELDSRQSHKLASARSIRAPAPKIHNSRRGIVKGAGKQLETRHSDGPVTRQSLRSCHNPDIYANRTLEHGIPGFTSPKPGHGAQGNPATFPSIRGASMKHQGFSFPLNRPANDPAPLLTDDGSDKCAALQPEGILF